MPFDLNPELQDLPPHTYQPLSSENTIRILRLEPGGYNDPICCTLIEVKLDEQPRYEAISYAWGSESHERPLKCDRSLRCIRLNLYEGL